MNRATLPASGLALIVAPILLLSARDGGTSTATEPPAPPPPTTVPATTVPVEPSTTTTGVSPTPPSTAAPETTPVPGGPQSTPPGTWQIGEPVTCTTPWGAEEPAWCDERVHLWIRADGTCWVTPAGAAAGRTCPTRDDELDLRLPETAAGSRWA